MFAMKPIESPGHTSHNIQHSRLTSILEEYLRFIFLSCDGHLTAQITSYNQTG